MKYFSDKFLEAIGGGSKWNAHLNSNLRQAQRVDIR